jgi:hypothetical protein
LRSVLAFAYRESVLRRAAIALVAFLHVLAATDALPSILDRVAPLQAAAPVAEDFPCREHTCGCHTAEQCRTSCCCFPRAPRVIVEAPCASCETPAPPPPPRIDSRYLADRCAGGAAHRHALSTADAPVDLPPAAALPAPLARSGALVAVERRAPLPPDLRDRSKIPI